MRRLIPLLLVIVFLLPSVSADFNAFGDQALTLNQCDTTTRTLSIQNIGEAASYSLSIEGDGADFLTFSALSFALETGQIAEVTAFYTIPCDARPGHYIADIYFFDGVTEKVIPQDIIISTPDNINLTTTSTSAVIAPCETASYPLYLHNPFNYTEIYTITASGHPNVHISEPTTVLLGLERKTLLLSVTPEDCTDAGQYELTATVESDKTDLHKELNLELIIKTTDIPLLGQGVSTIRTDYQASSTDFTIQNTGDRDTTYDLDIEGPAWLGITPTTITLGPGQSQTAKLHFTPAPEDAKGTYPALITATVQQTGIQYSKALTVKLKPLTGYERNPAPYIALIVLAIIVLALLISAFFYTRSSHFKQKKAAWNARRALKKKQREARKAEKKRRKEEKRQRKMQKKRERYEKNLKLKQKKQQQKEAERNRLRSKVEREFKKAYYLVSRKDVVKGTKKERNNAALLFGIVVIVLALIGWNVLAANLLSVIIGAGILIILYIMHKIARARAISRHWKLNAAGTSNTLRAWKTGLTSIAITTKQALKDFGIRVKKTRAPVRPSPYVYQTIDVKTNVPADHIKLKTTYSISKYWMQRKQLQIKDLKLGKYANQRWQTLPLSKTGEDKEHLYFTADIGTGVYSIYAKPARKIYPRPRILGWVTALVIIAGLAIALAPEPTGTTVRGIPPQTWHQDSLHNIDLTPYFTDPDGDTLVYSASETQHILIDIRGTTAYLTPEDGWTGTELVTFIADDGKGGHVESNRVTLRVTKNLISPGAQPYVALGIGILAVLMLLFLVRDLTLSRKR